MTIKYTHRTAAGELARIICRDRQDDRYPVIALVRSDGLQQEMCYYLTEDLGRTDRVGKDTTPWLTERSPWEDVAVDTPVWVLQKNREPVPRHFHKYDGKYIWLFTGGLTSHTGSDSYNLQYSPDEVVLEKPTDA